MNLIIMTSLVAALYLTFLYTKLNVFVYYFRATQDKLNSIVFYLLLFTARTVQDDYVKLLIWAWLRKYKHFFFEFEKYYTKNVWICHVST